MSDFSIVNDTQTTSVDSLKTYAAGQVVKLPDFAEGQPFVVRMRRPSMMALAKQGHIPNSLLTQAGKLFAGGSAIDTDDSELLSDMLGICEVIARSSMIEPTYDDVINAGLELSDDQMMAIFNYTQSGVKALENFRS